MNLAGVTEGCRALPSLVMSIGPSRAEGNSAPNARACSPSWKSGGRSRMHLCPQSFPGTGRGAPPHTWALPAGTRLEPQCPCASPSPSTATSPEPCCALLFQSQTSPPPGPPGDAWAGVRWGVSAGQHLPRCAWLQEMAKHMEDSTAATRVQPMSKPSPPTVMPRALWPHGDGFFC